MHPSSMKLMSGFIDKHLKSKPTFNVLDVGSMSVSGGAYNELFKNVNCVYNGLDIEPGPNVDIVAPDPYKWPVLENFYDVVISGQCMEHVEAIWLWVKEIERVCKPGGLTCIIAPWRWDVHRHPVDCWRILPDGLEYIMTKHCKFIKMECQIIGTDCYFIGIK